MAFVLLIEKNRNSSDVSFMNVLCLEKMYCMFFPFESRAPIGPISAPKCKKHIGKTYVSKFDEKSAVSKILYNHPRMGTTGGCRSGDFFKWQVAYHSVKFLENPISVRYCS